MDGIIRLSGKEGFYMKEKKKGGLFAGVLVGLLMVIIGTGLLWWNEGNNVRNIKTTDEIEKKVVEIASDSDSAAYAGQLVALGDKFIVRDEEIADDTFHVSLHTAALHRVVEVYQWEEESDTDSDGDTTYSYKKVWHEGLIDSSSFSYSGHDNPDSVAYSSDSFYAEEVILGNYRLSSSQIAQMDTDKTFTPSESTADIPKGYTLNGQYIISSEDVESPQIGDVRISWKYNGWKEVSLIAQVSGSSFVSYTSEVGKNVNYVTEGVKTAAQMIEEIRNQDKMMKWMFRLIGALLIFVGYMSFISPLTKLLNYIPILGNVVNFMFGLMVFLLSLLQSLLVIIIAWFRFRPLLSLCLLAVCAVIGVLIFLLKKKQGAKAPQAA